MALVGIACERDMRPHSSRATALAFEANYTNMPIIQIQHVFRLVCHIESKTFTYTHMPGLSKLSIQTLLNATSTLLPLPLELCNHVSSSPFIRCTDESHRNRRITRSEFMKSGHARSDLIYSLTGGSQIKSQPSTSKAKHQGGSKLRDSGGRTSTHTLSTFVWTISIISMRFSAGIGSLDLTTGVARSFRSAVSCDMSAAILVAVNVSRSFSSVLFKNLSMLQFLISISGMCCNDQRNDQRKGGGGGGIRVLSRSADQKK